MGVAGTIALVSRIVEYKSWQLCLQQTLHNIPCSPWSSSDTVSHGKSVVQDGSIPVLRYFEAPGSLPAVGGGLFSLVEVAAPPK